MVGVEDTDSVKNYPFLVNMEDGLLRSNENRKYMKMESGSCGDHYSVQFGMDSRINEDGVTQAWCSTFFASKNETFQLKDNYRVVQEKLEARFSRIKKYVY